jgi:hypothetical protein
MKPENKIGGLVNNFPQELLITNKGVCLLHGPTWPLKDTPTPLLVINNYLYFYIKEEAQRPATSQRSRSKPSNNYLQLSARQNLCCGPSSGQNADWFALNCW